MAATRLEERLLASLGGLQTNPLRFEAAEDVPGGGVMCAVPALLEMGLLRHSREKFSLPPGYYPLESIFLVLAFLALARVPSLEAVRYEPPGEWGKVVGLDRIPEVRTLREKLGLLCQEESAVREWSGALAREWMEAQPQSAGVLCVDGHVRLYFGGLTELPRRYVARQRLCLRGTTDYWVNALDGQPFFVVSQPSDPGLIKVLEEQIVPRLLKEAPGQPGAEALAAEPLLCRLTLIFDRGGYSPEFFARLWALRIAVITYHKFPGDPWPREEFQSRAVRLINGERVELEMAEREVTLSNGFKMREVRHREEDGHQVAVLSSDYKREMGGVAVAVFARWCQENFFQYMRRHYGLDRLLEYGTEPLPETTVVVNPAWRRLDQAARRERALLTRQQAAFAALALPPAAPAESGAPFEEEKGRVLQKIQDHQRKLEELKGQRKAQPKHLPLKDLPEKERFQQLCPTKKHFVDTIKLIAYRAETALVLLLREKLQRSDDARSLARQIFTSAADLCPAPDQKTLTVRIHRLSSPLQDAALEHLCAELTASETQFPGTDLRMVFEPVGTTLLPRDQES